MGMYMPALDIFMRFLNILSAITLVGGALTWKFAFVPATEHLSAETRSKTGDALARAWRPFVLAAILGALISGTYNLVGKMQSPLPPAYHPIIGIKILLALHVFAVLWLVTKPGNEKRARQLTGVMFSAIVIVTLGAVLRWLTA